MTQIHQSAQSGFSKSSAAYASGRPGYPELSDAARVCFPYQMFVTWTHKI